jgi:hypothetical protein
LIKIVEVLGRSEQGATRPFLCRGDDERIYYVKGRDAGRRSLLAEWAAAHLARALDLPIADFAVVEVPALLVAEDLPDLKLSDLGSGPAFGSALISSGDEFAIVDLNKVPHEVRVSVLVFDRWIRNEDRSLTEKGGNPNLLWLPGARRLVLIDHNLAFAREFDCRVFLETHVFAGDAGAVWDDNTARVRWSNRLSELLPVFERACDNAPESWFHEDGGGVPVDFDRREIHELLTLCGAPEFWKIEQ